MQNKLKLALILSLTLGLAPFTPEPHIWKQFQNLRLGRTMETMDWVDVLLHGAPWVFLIAVLIRMAVGKKVRK
ncbi:MAG: hypothetical protein COA33_004655 [Fluviicola sp.]|nr:hypothetical protein [Fluviicola sp.]